MPPAPVPPRSTRSLRRPNHAVVALLRPRGAPHSLATWYDWEDGCLLLNLEPRRRRLEWMRGDGRIALTAIDPGTFYRHVSVGAEIERITGDPGLTDIDRLSRRYTGRPYPRRDHARVSVWARVVSWHGWDRSPEEPAQPDRTRLPMS